MKRDNTLSLSSLSSCLKSALFKILLPALLAYTSSDTAQAQSGSPPLSTLNCDQVQVSLPVSLSFSSSVPSTITDKNGAGTGFTMVAPYSGNRLTEDGTPSNSSVPGYEASKLTLSNGKLHIVTNKGIAFLTNNNQLNALGVKVDSRGKLQVQTTLINPYNGTSGQQGGLWFGLNDKTFLKLVVIANKVELRREINDVSSTLSGTGNPDQRVTAVISGLNTQTVRLRLVVDPVTNTAEGFYSTDGVNYLNAGAAYSTKALSIGGIGLTDSTAYAGIYASHRNSTTPASYTFEDFSITDTTTPDNSGPVFSAKNYTYSISEEVALGTLVGSVEATDPNSDALSYSIKSGNTNGAFAINNTTGAITVAKFLNHHTQDKFSLTVRVADAGGLSDEAVVGITVTAGTTTPAFTTISWGTSASQPYGTHEVHGVVVNGKLFVFGGYDVRKRPAWTPTKRSYVYDPVNNTWTRIADLPHTSKGNDFGGITHEGLTTDGTDIYFAGGYTSNADGTGQIFSTKQVWKYNVATNTYTALPSMPQALAAGQLQYLNGKIHYMGGANASRLDVSVHYALDLDNLSAGWKALAPLSNPRNHAGSEVYEGKIYFIGGAHNQNNATVTQKTVEVYDPNSNTWTAAADMPIGLDHISSAVTVMGTRILVLGGETSHTVKSSRVLAYSPDSNTWTDLTPLPVSKSAGVAVSLKGAIYYTGGNFSTVNRKGIPGTTSSLPSPIVDSGSEIQDLPIKVYPNPSSGGTIRVEVQNLSQQESATLLLQDIAGRVLEIKNVVANDQGNVNIVLSTGKRLRPGLYLLKVQTAAGKAQAKLVVK